MSRILGSISRTELGVMQKRGLSPKAAFDALMAEARARNPKAETVLMRKSDSHDGFDIIAI